MWGNEMNDGMITNRGFARRLTMAAVVTAMIVGLFSLGMGVASAATPNVTTSTGGAYTALATPTRIADTRAGSGLPNAGQTMTAGGSIVVQLPASVAGAAAVALNVTATNTTGTGFFTVYPTGGSLPVVSSLNYLPGETVPNFVIVPVGTSNQITIYNGPPKGTGGSADAVVDLLGSFATAANTSGGAGHLYPLAPARITDTRAGSGQPNAGNTIGAAQSLAVQVTGAGGVPSTGVSAVVLNVTEADNTVGGFLTVYPQGGTAPTSSNLNFIPGQIVANRVIVPVSASGQIDILNHAGSTDVTVDVNGYFSDSTGSASAGSLFTPVTPARVIDTRTTAPIGPAGNLTVPITVNGIAGFGATAAVLNITEADNTAGGFLTVSPTAPAPVASDVNFVPGLIVANGDIAALSSAGSVNVFNHAGNTDAILDVAGYFTPAASTVVTGSVTFSPSTGAAGSTVTGTVTNPASVAGIAITGCGVSQVVPASAINQTTGVFTFVIPIGQATGSCSLAFASQNADGTSTTSTGPFTVTAAVTNQTYTVTPTAAQAVPVTNVVLYTATGLGTVPVDIQLFNCANVSNTSGTVTFPNSTNPGGTGNVAQPGTNTGQITVLNGAPTGLGAGVPDNGVTPVSGQATFSVTDATTECVTPVVFQQGAAGGSQNLLPLGTNNQPTVPFGVGGSATFVPPQAGPGAFSTAGASTPVVTTATPNFFAQGGNAYFYSSTATYQLYSSATATCGPDNFADFQARLSQGDAVSGFYTPTTQTGTSVFCLKDQAAGNLGPLTASAAPSTQAAGGVTVTFTNLTADEGTDNITAYNVYRTNATVPTVTGAPYTCPAALTTTGPAASPQTAPAAPTYGVAGTVPAQPTPAQQAGQPFTYSAVGGTGTYTYNDATATTPIGQTPPNVYCYAVSPVSPNQAGGTQAGTAFTTNNSGPLPNPTTSPTATATTPAPVNAAPASPTTVPTFISATAGGTQVDVFYNQTINPATLDTADFTVTATTTFIIFPVTTAETVSTVAVNGTNGVTLTVTPALSSGATVLVTSKTGSDGNTVCSTGSTTNCQAVGNAVQATAGASNPVNTIVVAAGASIVHPATEPVTATVTNPTAPATPVVGDVVTFTSSNPAHCTVNPTGTTNANGIATVNVTGVAAGTCTITATDANGGTGTSGTITVT
jgi:hypothetical protein